MARPEKDRIVASPPPFSAFKPHGVRTRGLQRIVLRIDEYEAVRLADYRQLDHSRAAQLMGISRPTFTRLLESARRKTAAFFMEGLALVIEGGSVHFRDNSYVCIDCRHRFTAPIDREPECCPECGSPDITGTAAGFGHGECCREFLEGSQTEEPSDA